MRQTNQVREGRQLPMHGTFDAVVSGGGLSGVACAVILAHRGAQVLLVERRTTLAWEVVRALRVFMDLESLARHSACANELHQLLVDHHAYSVGVIQPAIAELVIDSWVRSTSITCLVQAWPVQPMVQAGNVKGLTIATRAGYSQVLTPCLVETDEQGRLVAERPTHHAYETVRTFLLSGVDIPSFAPFTFTCRGYTVQAVKVRAGLARVDLTMPEPTYWEREQAVANLMPSLLAQLRTYPGFTQAWLAQCADEEWVNPTPHLQPMQTDKEDLVGYMLDDSGDRSVAVQRAEVESVQVKGLYQASPWLPCCQAGVKESVVLANRLLLGELVGNVAS